MPTEIQTINEENTEETVIISLVESVNQPIFISVDETAPPVYAVNGRVGYIFLDKNDVGLSNVENLSIIGVSGYLQNQISSLDLDYATDADLAIISGNLVASGSNLINLISSLSGYVVNSDSYLSGYFQDSASYTAGLIGSLSGALNNSGQYLAYQIGDLTNLINSTSGNLQFQINNIYSYGFLTGFNSGDYVLKSQTGDFATKSELAATGIDLQNQIYNIYNSGFLTGFNSGDYVLKSQTGDFISRADTGNFVGRADTGVFATKVELVNSGDFLFGAISDTSGNLQSQINALDGSYATDAQLTGLGIQITDLINDSGVYLQNQIDILNDAGFITGVDLSPYYPRTNPSGYLVQSDLSPYLTGFNSGDYVLKADTGVFATSESLNQSGSYLQALTNSASGNLQSQLNNLDLNYASQAEFDSLSGKLNNSGSNLQNQINNLYSSGFITTSSANYQFVSVTGNQRISGQKTFVSGLILNQGTGLASTLITSLDDIMNGIKIGERGSPNGCIEIRSDLINIEYPPFDISFFLNLQAKDIYLGSEFYTFPNYGGTFALKEADIAPLSGALNETGINLYRQITDASGLLQSQIYQTGLDLNNKIISFSGDFLSSGALLDSKIYSLSGNLLSTGQLLWNAVDSLSGSLLSSGSLLWDRDVNISGSLNATGISLYNSIEEAKILAIAYAIAL